MDPARALVDARNRAGLTQAHLARRGGTSQATISAYESGRKAPSIETFARLLAATGSHLTVTEGPDLQLSREQPARNGRILAEVLDLAEALPARKRGELRYPRLAA